MKLTGKPYEAHLLAVIVLYILGFSIYLNSLSVPFVFDDYPNIRDNPSIRLQAIDVNGLREAAFESRAHRRPLANISFALNYAADGYRVKWYHVVNVLIHIVNGVLVYFLALILLARDQAKGSRGSTPSRRLWLVALFAAAIFVAHPLQVQAVTMAPRYAQAHANLSVALERLGKPRESCRHLVIALELDSAVSYSESARQQCDANSNAN